MHYTAYTNIGVIYFKFFSDYKKAIDNFLKSLLIKEDNEIALYNLGCCFGELGSVNKAIEYFKKTLDVNKNHNGAKFNLSIRQLLKYDFKDGWINYEARKKIVGLQKSIHPNEESFGIPAHLVWKGKEACNNIFIHSEQGIGDEVLISSLYGELNQLHKNIKISCDKRLIAIFKRSFPGIDFLDKKKNFNVDAETKHIFSFSLGKFLRKNKFDFQNNKKAWLSCNSSFESLLKNRFHKNKKKIIGISWKSSQDIKKNIDLEYLIKIFPKDKYLILNLQYGEINNEINAIESKYDHRIECLKEIDYKNDLDKLCSLINICDLVITTSNVTAHFAGALSKKTFLLLSTSPLFYWGEKGNSIWYPSIEIFRQKTPGDWTFPLHLLAKNI